MLCSAHWKYFVNFDSLKIEYAVTEEGYHRPDLEGVKLFSQLKWRPFRGSHSSRGLLIDN